MESSNVFTALPNTLEQEWASPSASELSSAQAGAFGLNLSPEGARHFTLRSQPENLNAKEPPMPQGTILLVEDNLADAGLVREALEEHGVEGELLVISDGDRAIRFIQSLDTTDNPCPDLVIVDLNLPKRPGREVLECMRKSAKCRDVAVVVLSSSDAAQDKADAFRLGATQYIRKPLRLSEFLGLGSIFRRMLEDRRGKGN